MSADSEPLKSGWLRPMGKPGLVATRAWKGSIAKERSASGDDFGLKSQVGRAVKQAAAVFARATGKFYVFGGYSDGSSTGIELGTGAVLMFDPDLGRWEVCAEPNERRMSGQEEDGNCTAPPWPAPRWGHTATILQDGRRMLVLGGQSIDDHGSPLWLADVWLFDTVTRRWRELTKAPESISFGCRAGHTCSFVDVDSQGNNRFLIFGGFSVNSGAGTPEAPQAPLLCMEIGDDSLPTYTSFELSQIEVSDGNTQIILSGKTSSSSVSATWKGLFPSSRAHHSAVVLFGIYLCIFGGRWGEKFFSSLWVLELCLDRPRRWFEFSLPTMHARAYHTCTALDSATGILIGGSDPRNSIAANAVAFCICPCVRAAQISQDLEGLGRSKSCFDVVPSAGSEFCLVWESLPNDDDLAMTKHVAVFRKTARSSDACGSLLVFGGRVAKCDDRHFLDVIRIEHDLCPPPKSWFDIRKKVSRAVTEEKPCTKLTNQMHVHSAAVETKPTDTTQMSRCMQCSSNLRALQKQRTSMKHDRTTEQVNWFMMKELLTDVEQFAQNVDNETWQALPALEQSLLESRLWDCQAAVSSALRRLSNKRQCESQSSDISPRRREKRRNSSRVGFGDVTITEFPQPNCNDATGANDLFGAHKNRESVVTQRYDMDTFERRRSGLRTPMDSYRAIDER